MGLSPVSRLGGRCIATKFSFAVAAALVIWTSTNVLLAVPSAPIVHTLVQPDGTKFQARQWGDEWLHGWETVDGYSIVLDKATQNWTYAERRLDGALAASASVVGREAPPVRLGRHLRPTGAALGRAHSMRASAQAVAGTLAVPSSGTANVAAMLINFSDTTTTYTAGNFTTLLFGTGTWSMRDYYSEVSYGRFTVSAGAGGVAGWFTASNTHDYYGANNAEGKDVWPGDLVYEAVSKADAAGFNFAPYDQNGDCYVDAVNIIHQGAGAEVEGNPETNIWSHSWNLNSAQYYGRSHYAEYTTNDPCLAGGYVKVNAYVIQPETLGSGMTTVGVFAHEFGHALGVPDLYDTDDSSEGVGEWSLMGAGSWCGLSRRGDRPAHLDAWNKAKLGWVTPHQVTGTLASEAISQAETSADVYQLLVGSPGQTGEYFLVENRQLVNFDAGLAGSGLLIWHIDESQTDNSKECYPGGPSCAAQHFKVALAQADGAYDLEKKTNQGNAGDPFPGSTSARSFTGGTSPSRALYSGQASGASVTAISDSAATMTATLALGASGGVEVTVFSDNFEGSFPGSWRPWTDSNTTPQWGKVTCKSSSGSGSAWCAAGGSAAQPPCSQYLGNMNTWMIYGPFSLADATEASAEFDAWYDTEAYNQSVPKGDQFEWLISTDGTNFWGDVTSGGSNGWVHKVFNFKDVTNITAVGSANVWFAFVFKSDPSVQGGGAYVDNFVIRKTVAVAAACAYSISPTSQTFTAASGTGTVNVTITSGSNCSWTAASNEGWITITGGASGTGNGTVNYSVAANTGGARSGTLTIAGQTFAVNQEVSCPYWVSPSSASVVATGGPGSVAVTAPIGCSWTATSNAEWISVTSGATGSGNGSVGYFVQANTGDARTGTLTIADQIFSVSQAKPTCSYSISPTQQAFGYAGGTGTVDVTITSGSNCSWTTTSHAAWITVSGGASGTGNGTVSYSVASNTGGARSGTITIAGRTFAVNQGALICSYSISPSSASIAATGGTGSVDVTAPTGCSWAVTSSAGWISITSGGSGSGNGSVGYSVSANTGVARTGTVTIAGQTFTVSQAAPPCSYSINPTQKAFGYAGGTGAVDVTAGSWCSWSSSSNAAWISVTGGAAGTGNGTVSYSVAANTGGARSGTLTIAGQTLAVNQDALDCSYSITPSSTSLAAAGGTGSVAVAAPTGCSWTATSNAGWILVTSGASGSGNGSVGYSVQANTGAARSGTLTVAGQTFTVSQAAPACSYSISPTQQVFGYVDGTGSVSVTAASVCSWSSWSNSAWITITSGASGTGNGTVTYSVVANTSGARSGTLTIAGQTFTVNQDGFTCAYSIFPAQGSFASSGGTGSVAVTAAPTCSWTATSNASWITITGGASGSGNGSVGYSVAATSAGARSGSMVIAGQVFTVLQEAAGCSYSISPPGASFDQGGGSGSFGVTAPSACSWTATSDSSWLRVTGVSGSGNGMVAYSVAANSGVMRTGQITVQSQIFTVSQASGTGVLDFSHWLGAVSHVDGANNSHWRSDVAVLNRSSLPASVEFRLYTPGGLIARQATVSGNAQEFRQDIAAWLGYETGSGSLEVRSDQDVFVMARTYNQVDATHSYGQNYDGQEPDGGLLSAGQSAWLPLLAQNPDFRCNIAITNTGPTAASVTLALYDGDGNQLWSGSDESNAVAPGGFVQYLKPFLNYAGRNDIVHGYAKVTVNWGSGVIVWASVMDENSGDPTTIFMKH